MKTVKVAELKRSEALSGEKSESMWKNACISVDTAPNQLKFSRLYSCSGPTNGPRVAFPACLLVEQELTGDHSVQLDEFLKYGNRPGQK